MKSGIVFIIFLVILSIFFSGCVQNTDNHTQNASQSSKIRVSGAYALYPMMLTWAEKYQNSHPDVKIEVSAGGAGKGMTDVLSGQVEIGMISRDIYPEEEKQGAKWVSVAKDAVVPTINIQNPAYDYIQRHGINQSTFQKIFINQSVTMWSEINGDGNNSSDIRVYTRSDSCGAAEIWAKYLGYKQDNLKGIGIASDPGIADAVMKDPNSIGYNNINYAYNPDTGLLFPNLAIAPLDINDDGIISDDESFYQNRTTLLEAINSDTYPSPPARKLNLAVKGTFSGETQRFINWILSDGQQYTLASGYIPLDPDSVDQMKKILNS